MVVWVKGNEQVGGAGQRQGNHYPLTHTNPKARRGKRCSVWQGWSTDLSQEGDRPPQ